MLDYKIKIGLAMIRRDVSPRPEGAPFNKYAAARRGKALTDYILANYKSENVEFVDNRGIGEDDLIFNNEGVKQVIERFQNEKVDALFLVNVNFGNEEAIADIAKAIGKPVLIWPPLDEDYYDDGVRPTDSQCGIFGISRQLQRYHIPFSYLPCCRVDSEEFVKGFDSFVRVACMVKNFTGMRIGQVGSRPAPFFSVIWNEGELMEKFGVKFVAFNFTHIQQRMKQTAENCKDEIAEVANYILKTYTMDDLTPAYIDRMATMTVMYKNLMDEYELDVLSAECWTATLNMFDGLAPCTVYSILNDMGYLVACESDVHAAMTMVLLSSVTLGKGKVLFGEFTVRHPEDKNVELLWHCGPFPVSQKAESGVDSEARLVNQRSWFRAKDGVYTVARMDQESGDYMLLPLVCKTATGPKTSGTYLWAEFEDLQAVENRIIEGPYIHHFVEVEGDYRKELAEFTKYFPNVKIDKI